MDHCDFKCRIGGTEHVGTFELRGYILILRCEFGTIKATVGLDDPAKLAKKLLRILHKRHRTAAARLEEDEPSRSHVRSAGRMARTDLVSNAP